jgi:hypothetical protein
MVEDNLSRLEVTSGIPKLRADYMSGRKIRIEPFGNVSFRVYENGEYVGLIHGDELAEHVH